MGLRFFVAETLPSLQSVAAKNLINQGYGVFDPRVIKNRKHPRFQSLIFSEQPLYSGYIFLSFDRDVAPWRSINGTRGVRKLMCNGESPIAVPVGVVEAIRLAYDAGAFDDREPVTVRLQKGELGQVIDGPFGSFIGECMVSEPVRALLDLEIFGRRVPTWVPVDNVIAA